IDFLGRMMRLRPMPVIMISSLTQKQSEISMRALELGAVDVIGKPATGVRQGMMEYSHYIADRIRAAAVSRPRAGQRADARVSQPRLAEQVEHKEFASRSNWLVAIGASTGGTEAILRVLK